MSEVYLGDGLYASFDGWQVKLRAAGDAHENVVYLEPQVLGEFQHYIAMLDEAMKETAKKELREPGAT